MWCKPNLEAAGGKDSHSKALAMIVKKTAHCPGERTGREAGGPAMDLAGECAGHGELIDTKVITNKNFQATEFKKFQIKRRKKLIFLLG